MHLKRVLFIETTHSAIGGVGSRQVRLAEALPARGWSAIFALTRGGRFHDPDRYRANLPHFEHVELDARTGSSEGRRMAVQAAIRRTKPDVVLPGAVHDAWIVAEALKPEGPRIVYGLPGIDFQSIAFVAGHAASVDAAFGVSPVTTCLLSNYCAIPASRVFTVPTGVKPPERVAGPPVPGLIRLLYVGRFDDDKRVSDAIALADELAARGVSFRMTLVGSGMHGDALQAATVRHAGCLRVVAPMTVGDLYASVYPEADAILLFSSAEGLPNALLEGMAHGLVPVTSDFAGRAELALFRDGETAMVFPVGDVAAAADRVEALVCEPERLAGIGSAARGIVERERSVGRMADEFVQVVERAIAGEPCLPRSGSAPLEGRSRLRRLLGPNLAERVRRTIGLSFRHVDAGEWPLIGSFNVPDAGVEEARFLAAVERCQHDAVTGDT